MPHTPKPIVYRTTEIDGIPIRPNSRELLARAAASCQPIEVYAESSYVNLYHVFARMQTQDKSLRDLTLIRKKIEDSRWWIWAVRRDELRRESY